MSHKGERSGVRNRGSVPKEEEWKKKDSHFRKTEISKRHHLAWIWQKHQNVQICSVCQTRWSTSSASIVKSDEPLSCAYQWTPLNTCHPWGMFFFFLAIPVIVSSPTHQWLLNYIWCMVQRCSKTIRWNCQGRPSIQPDAPVVSDFVRLHHGKKLGLSGKCQQLESVTNRLWQGKIRMSFGFECKKKLKPKKKNN